MPKHLTITPSFFPISKPHTHAFKLESFNQVGVGNVVPRFLVLATQQDIKWAMVDFITKKKHPTQATCPFGCSAFKHPSRHIKLQKQ